MDQLLVSRITPPTKANLTKVSHAKPRVLASSEKLIIRFCDSCGVDAVEARIAKEEFLITVRELMQHMNARYDNLDPKKGAALSPTETLVSVHALTMLVDTLAATELEQFAAHPYIE